MAGYSGVLIARTDHVAYANETNIVNKDSPIDSLTSLIPQL